MGCLQDFYIIRKINTLLAKLNFTASHVFREGNQCADWLARFGAHSGIFFGSQPELLTCFSYCGMIRLDKLGFPFIGFT